MGSAMEYSLLRQEDKRYLPASTLGAKPQALGRRNAGNSVPPRLPSALAREGAARSAACRRERGRKNSG